MDALNLRSTSKLPTAIKNRSEAGGFKWAWYDDCSEQMRNAFGGCELPVHSASPGTRIQQVDPATDAVVREFVNLSVACREFKGCRGGFKKACDDGTLYKDFRWKRVSDGTRRAGGGDDDPCCDVDETLVGS
jgi:hypothetical protein